MERGPDAMETDRRLEGRRLLVVDDNLLIRTVVRRVLSGAGARVTEAMDGLEALAATQSDRYDAILMDVDMPRLDGLSAIRRLRIRERETGRPRTPVLVLSAKDSSADVEAARTAGADLHLAKPFAPESLRAAVCALALGVLQRPSATL